MPDMAKGMLHCSDLLLRYVEEYGWQLVYLALHESRIGLQAPS